MLKAVLFDMDGVLVDSEPVHFAANYKMLRDKFGIEFTYEENQVYLGSTVEAMWKALREKYGLYEYRWDELMVMAENVLDDMVEQSGLPPIEGAAETVRELKQAGYILAVVSSSSMEKIRKNIDDMGIADCFDALVSGAGSERPKPNPDIFLKAAETVGLLPEECIVIEDSDNGVRAAKAAGMACMGYVPEYAKSSASEFHPAKEDGKQKSLLPAQLLPDADCIFESFRGIDEAFIRMVHNHCFGIPWTVMKTDRLTVREVCEADIDALMAIYEAPGVTRYMEGLYPREDELAYIRSYISNIYGFYGYGMWILEKKDGTVIGRAGIEYYENDGAADEDVVGELALRNEAASEKEEDRTASGGTGCHLMGYLIAEEEQRRGYAYEACSAVISYAREVLGIEKIKVRIHKDNEPSIRLAVKLGFVFDKQ